MTPPLRVCFVCQEYPPEAQGGIGTFTQMVGRYLVRAGWSVRVLGFRSREYSGPDIHEDEGVQVHRLTPPDRDAFDVRAIARLYRTVKRWANAGEIDLVELPDAQGWAAGWPPLAVPVIARVHGSSTYFGRELGRPLSRGNYWRERLSIRRADAWCSVSHYAGNKTQEIFDLNPPGAISRVPVAVPEPVDPDRRVRNRVVYTGTLTPKKGIERLLEAWPEVAKQIPDSTLEVYGKDIRSNPSTTEILLERLDEASRASVKFHGHRPRPELLEALQTASVAVFPSYAEAFAFAPIEAMATGCPTVYSSRTSGAELVQHGVNGLLIDPDQPQQIANAVVSILSDEGLAQRLGEAGRKSVVNNYTIEKLGPQIASFYWECVRAFGMSKSGRLQPVNAPAGDRGSSRRAGY